MNFGAPFCNLIQGALRPLGNDVALTEENLARAAIYGDPVTLGDRRPINRGASCLRVDLQTGAADDAGLAHLPRHESRMRRAAARCGDDAGGRGKALDVGGIDVGTDQNDGIAGSGMSFRLCRIERCDADGDAARGTYARSG
jgi:hypothetical protein